VRAYFTRHIVYPLSPRHLAGLQLFRKLVVALEPVGIVIGQATGETAV
jgi:hypothetical protein